jgi:hypothetical protein
MQPHRTVDEAPTPQPPASALVTAPVVPQRSARRATARRASNRRATARLHKDDIEARVSDYLNEHPLSTTGDLAKGAKRRPRQGRRGAVAHRQRRRDRQGPHGQVTGAQMLRNHVTPEPRGSDHARGPTITARFDDGPLQGIRIETEVIEGRPPSTIDVPADDSSTCRYCLAEWAQSGPSATYTFLYRV